MLRPLAFFALPVHCVLFRPIALFVFQTGPSLYLRGWGQGCGIRVLGVTAWSHISLDTESGGVARIFFGGGPQMVRRVDPPLSSSRACLSRHSSPSQFAACSTGHSIVHWLSGPIPVPPPRIGQGFWAWWFWALSPGRAGV